MADRGAPNGNKNAKKEAAGRKLVVYLSADDLQLLRYVQEKYEGDTSDAACLDLARKAAKCGINNLLNPEYYEVATKRVLKERKNIMQAQELKEFKQQITATLNAFLESPDFEDGCTSATKASWGGSGYSVELFTDGTWRVLWDHQIGNKYETPGVILSLPTINDDEYQQLVNGSVDDDEDDEDSGYGNGAMSEEEFFSLGFQNEFDDLAKELRDQLSDDFAMRYSN